MKAVQGDTGHAQLKMVSDVYSHIIDEDRRTNASRFEQAFYQKRDLTDVAIQKEFEERPEANDAQQVMQLLSQSPELASQLLQLIKANVGKQEQALSR